MKPLCCLLALATVIAGKPVLAQNPIAELGGSTYREKAVYAVYDLPGTTRQADAIEGIVLDAIRTNRTDGALVRIIAPIVTTEADAERQAVSFAQVLFPMLKRYLPA